jgi:hypothetical protein
MPFVRRHVVNSAGIAISVGDNKRRDTPKIIAMSLSDVDLKMIKCNCLEHGNIPITEVP